MRGLSLLGFIIIVVIIGMIAMVAVPNFIKLRGKSLALEHSRDVQIANQY